MNEWMNDWLVYSPLGGLWISTVFQNIHICPIFLYIYLQGIPKNTKFRKTRNMHFFNIFDLICKLNNILEHSVKDRVGSWTRSLGRKQQLYIYGRRGFWLLFCSFCLTLKYKHKQTLKYIFFCVKYKNKIHDKIMHYLFKDN